MRIEVIGRLERVCLRAFMDGTRGVVEAAAEKQAIEAVRW
jgi:hypothetical protein